MSTTFRPYQPNQLFLLPPSPKDWLPEDHLAYFISETVDRLDVSVFYRCYEGDGRRNCPFDPRMMVKVLLYGYATGVRSSRKIAKKLHEDVAFRVLAAGNFPAHRTIAEFRQRHLKEFEELFVQVVQLAQEIGLLKLGTLALDGSKVKANASKRKAMSYGRMKKEERRVREEIGKLLEQAAAVDAEEDRLYGEEARGDELPEELRRREDRLAQIEAAQRRLKQRQAAADRAQGRCEGDERKSPRGGRRFKREFGVPEDKAQENFTDPDSRIMKSADGFTQAYNTQIAVDENTKLIVATGLTQCAADNGELLALVEEVERIVGEVPEQVLADAGYKGETNFEQLEHKGIDAYVSLAREKKKASSRPDERYPASQRMYDKLQSSTGQMTYRKRKGIVEPVYGWIKEILGFRRFSLRGTEKVTPEWDLVCCATNLKRLHAMFAWI
jgi:transposase